MYPPRRLTQLWNFASLRSRGMKEGKEGGGGGAQGGEEVSEKERHREEEKLRRRIFSTFVGTVATVGLILGSVMVFIERPDPATSRNRRFDVNRGSRQRYLPHPLKLLVLSDDEESATLMGDVLDQDSHAFYLYEPMWGFYQTMGYGMPALKYPWDINVNVDGTARQPPAYEVNLVQDVMKEIFDCRANHTPVEVLLNKFLFQKDDYSLRTIRHLTLEDFGYLSCVIKEFKGQEEVLRQIDVCKTAIKKYCPNFWYEGVLLNCYKMINMYKGAHQASKYVLNRIAQKPTNYLGDFIDHQLCLNDLKPKVQHCIHKFYHACHTADLIAAVTMRMNLDSIHEVAKAIPALKMLHITRDPRDTLAFTRANHFAEGTMDVSREAGRLCSKMWRDYQNLSALKQTNDTRVMQLKYEDIVQDPRESMRKLRVFMGMETDTSIPSVIRSLFLSGASDYSRTIELHHDVLNIGVWQRMFSPAEIMLMNQVCAGVIRSLGY